MPLDVHVHRIARNLGFTARADASWTTALEITDALRPLDPVTIFHEPINIRAENVQRIARHAAQLGITLRTEVFANRESWQSYALTALRTMRQVAHELGLQDRLHSWPDKSLGTTATVQAQPNPRRYLAELQQSWNRISEWP
jgi:hypothetical protein